MLSKLGEEGRKRAMWILKRVGLCEEDGIEPKFESNELSVEELEIFDEVEYAIMFDYEVGYNIALKAINRLVKLKRFRSALYVCDMIGDEIVRRGILKEGMLYYESVGDFKNAYEFARILGDERGKIYKELYELYLKVRGEGCR
ncbi:hypothetical protein [Archaeoglobus profundus]|uniref:Uncharacterized protein n=1 Tax=Archaeoglobus profundus (strain DSM 5631 / JCM 9629 / NBRC 100127 / Av18) TaxID=572546 RepID=D2RDA9_ARCPA|nr:hypothetical protein [Archaeoglobus profundus]ADB58103.1 hypothetical protein Arcpr_1044 [Archaeoglobus profundus DSM 5631]